MDTNDRWTLALMLCMLWIPASGCIGGIWPFLAPLLLAPVSAKVAMGANMKEKPWYKQPLLIFAFLGIAIACVAMVLMGGWLLKALGSLFGGGALLFGKSTMDKWQRAEEKRQQEQQAIVEHHRKKVQQVGQNFHDQARAQAAREAQTEEQIQQDKTKATDEQKAALLREAKEIDAIQ